MRHPSLHHAAASVIPWPAPRAGAARLGQPWRAGTREGQFQSLSAGFRRAGGLATGDEVAGLVQPHWDRPISTVARWIVSRSVLCFAWKTQTLLPLFQFARPTMLLRCGVPEILAELNPVFDDWEMALWFVEPNLWLDDDAPIELMASRPAEVIKAARADRFVAKG